MVGRSKTFNCSNNTIVQVHQRPRSVVFQRFWRTIKNNWFYDPGSMWSRKRGLSNGCSYTFPLFLHVLIIPLLLGRTNHWHSLVTNECLESQPIHPWRRSGRRGRWRWWNVILHRSPEVAEVSLDLSQCAVSGRRYWKRDVLYFTWTTLNLVSLFSNFWNVCFDSISTPDSIHIQLNVALHALRRS